jgi:hypothetical protein
MFLPVVIVPLWIIRTVMGAAAFLPYQCGFDHNARDVQHILYLKVAPVNWLQICGAL